MLPLLQVGDPRLHCQSSTRGVVAQPDDILAGHLDGGLLGETPQQPIHGQRNAQLLENLSLDPRCLFKDPTERVMNDVGG